MVIQCMSYNYNNTDTCSGSYEQCARRVVCPAEDGHHCFVVWLNGSTNPLSAGCNPPYPSAGDEKCSSQCVGQLRGPRYYCCCTESFCNQQYTIPEPLPLHPPETKEQIPEFVPPQNAPVTFITVIVIVSILIFIGIFVFRSKRIKRRSNDDANHHHHSHSHHDHQHTLGNGDTLTHIISEQSNNNRRNKGVSGDLNGQELNELKNNHNLPVLMPFRSTFDEEHFFNNNQNNLNNFNRTNDHFMKYEQSTHLHEQHSDNRIDLNSIKLLEVIGSGRFGTVHRASLDEKEIAVKIISSIEHSSWMNEQQIYNSPKIHHPNILNYLYSDEHLETESYWLVVEYAPKGSLYSYIKANTITWKQFVDIAFGIVHGLAHLHEADIAHRDFKSKNVLLKHDLSPCITDFGVAVILDTANTSQLDHRKKYLQVGTPRYMAPEVLECSVTFTNASFTKIDVYALSLVLWELLSRCHPLPKSAQDILAQVVSDPHDEPPAPYKLPFENEAGPNPDINRMHQVVVVDKMRPTLRDEWRNYPASEFCRAIVDGWEYDHDARISASCFVERIELLVHNV